MLTTNTVPLSKPFSYGESPRVASTMSADGRLVVFQNYDAQNQPHFYMQDTLSEAVSQIALPVAFRILASPQLSADGSKLGFIGKQGDAFSPVQIFVMDLRTGTLQVASSDAHGNGLSYGIYDAFSLSGDGSSVVFSSSTRGFIAGDDDTLSDIFLKDLKSGALSIVSDGNQGPNTGMSVAPQLSRDGKSVVFFTDGTGLGDGNVGFSRIVIKDVESGIVTSVNKDSGGSFSLDVILTAGKAMLSADSSKVAFDTGFGIYVKDLHTGTLQNVLTSTTGEPLRTFSHLDGISADGRYITFTSTASAVLAGDADSEYDVYQKDLQTGQLQLLTPHGPRSGLALGIAASDDGHRVLFASSDRLVLGDGAQGPFRTNGMSLNLAHTNGLSVSNGASTLFGSTGADQLAGGAGDDWYWVDNAADAVQELANAGHDTVFSLLANYTLPENADDLILGDTRAANVALVSNAAGSGNEMHNQLIGNADANSLSGMGGDDVLTGGAGNDALDGGNGFDIARFDGSLTGAKITRVNGGWQSNSTGNGVDTLQNIERLVFSDQGFSLPGDTHAAEAYRIYQAAFNRTPDAGGLGFWVKQIDNGASLEEVAHGFMQSAEFKNLYGSHPANVDMVTKFYQNVLHRAPDAGGLKFWTDVLNTGRGTPDHVLAQFSESPENVAALTGVIDAGFAYTLFK